MQKNDSFLSAAPEVFVLPNGLQVLIQEDNRFPLVALRMYVRAGSAYEEAEESGISHLLEHMAFKGDKDSLKGRAVERVEAVGGSLNAATSFDHTVYMLDLPAAEWEMGVDVLYALCCQAQCSKAELDSEKEVVLSELARNQDNPKRRLFETLQSRIWAETPYARPVIGDKEAIARIDCQMIQDYVSRLYQPQAMLLVVCGQVQTKQVLDKANKVFGGLANKEILTKEAISYQPRIEAKRKLYLSQSGLNKVYLGVGFLVPGLQSESVIPLELLAYLLGGDKTSILYRKFQYQLGLVDEISAMPVLMQGTGMIYIQAGLKQENLEEFWKQLFKELFSLKAESFTEEEFLRAKLNLEDGLMQTRETLSGMASRLGYFNFFEHSLQAEQDYMYNLRHAQLVELNEVIEAYLKLSGMQAALLVPELEKGQEEALNQELETWRAVQKTKEKETAQLDYQKKVLDLENGCKLVLLPDSSLPYTALDLTWSGGDLLLSSNEQGLAVLCAKSLVRGTKDLQAQEIQNFLASKASYVEAQASRDKFSLVSKFPTKFTPELTELFAQVVTSPAFRPEEVQKSAKEQSAYVLGRRDHPMGLVSQEIFPFLFEGHPFGYYHLGEPEGLASFSPEEVRGFWFRQSECSWVLSVCGSFQEDEVFALAKSLSRTSQGKDRGHRKIPNWTNQSILNLDLNDKNQAHILVVFPLPGIGHESNPSMALIKKVLAGQGGVLFQELREKQSLGYAVSPMLWRTLETGFLGFYIGTYSDRIDQCLKGFEDVVKTMQNSLMPDKVLQRAQNLLQVEYYQEKQSLLGRCSEASDLLTYGLPLNFQQEMIEKSRQVSAKELQKQAKEYLNWNKAYHLIASRPDSP